VPSGRSSKDFLVQGLVDAAPVQSQQAQAGGQAGFEVGLGLRLHAQVQLGQDAQRPGLGRAQHGKAAGAQVDTPRQRQPGALVEVVDLHAGGELVVRVEVLHVLPHLVLKVERDPHAGVDGLVVDAQHAARDGLLGHAIGLRQRRGHIAVDAAQRLCGAEVGVVADRPAGQVGLLEHEGEQAVVARHLLSARWEGVGLAHEGQFRGGGVVLENVPGLVDGGQADRRADAAADAQLGADRRTGLQGSPGAELHAALAEVRDEIATVRFAEPG
jgi:hypothetical protein